MTDATFRVTVRVEGRRARTYTVAAPLRGDGFEGAARTRAMFAYFHETDEEPDSAPLRGEFVDYDVQVLT